MDMLLGLDMLKRHQVIKSTHTSNNVSMYLFGFYFSHGKMLMGYCYFICKKLKLESISDQNMCVVCHHCSWQRRLIRFTFPSSCHRDPTKMKQILF